MQINKEFEKKWIESFVKNNLTEKFKNDEFIYLSQILDRFYIGGYYENAYSSSYGFLWHAMIANIIEFLKDKKADIEFDKIDKNGALEFTYDPEECKGLTEEPSKLSKNHKTSKQIKDEDLSEFYVIGKDWSWCYIRNHDEDTYFIYRK